MNKEKQEMFNNNGPTASEFIEAAERWSKAMDEHISVMDKMRKDFLCQVGKYRHPPKEWEIVAFKGKEHGTIIKGRFPGYTSSDYIGEKAVWDIWSVKRLSDGEVFTVGDETTIGSINKFVTEQGGLLARAGKDYHQLISELKKIKHPLFTTEDGKEIFGGDSGYIVSNDFRIVFCNPFMQRDGSNKCFSTKEAAEEYVLMSKPCLSLNDFMEIQKNHPMSYFTINLIIEKLKKVVKSKLK